MKLEDYSKYYIQGSDHYLIPKDVFKELFYEMVSWRDESEKLKQENKELKEELKYKPDTEITLQDDKGNKFALIQTERINAQEKLNKTIERLFNNWNKLKEYANKMHEYFLYTDVNEIYKQNMKEDNQFPNLFNLSELNASDKVLSSILNKMQELEQRSIEKLDETSINV
jgi:cell division septum initiation protein DivIVA